MTRLLCSLVRHADYAQPADTPSAHLPYPLTPAGREQALGLGEALLATCREHGLRLHPKLYSSSLLRAWETAVLAADRITELSGSEAEVVETDALAERSVGAMANLTLPAIEAIVRDDPRYDDLPAGWKSRSDLRLPFPGCESLREAGARVARFVRATLDEVRARMELDTLVAFVGHGAALRHAGVHLGFFADWEQAGGVSMHHARPVTLEDAGNGRWRHVAGEWKPRTLETRID